MITAWGGCEAFVIRAVQVLQNRAARFVTKKSWFTPTRILLLECNWLSIKQLVFYHTILQVWRVTNYNQPEYMINKLEAAVTRSGSQGNLRIPVFKSALCNKSFFVRAASEWNRIPSDIRNTLSISVFKKKAKIWIKNKVEIEEES